MTSPFRPATSPAPGRLRRLFEAALDRSADTREGWITAHVADSGERHALRRLLAAAATTVPDLLDTPVIERAARIGEVEEPRPGGLIGQRIGAFRLSRLLGQGGMATVFLGEREDADFVQQVAIKLLRRGVYSELEQRLFRRERQALAMLSHPNITHLIDGGVTEAGIPYLVMEYVDGVPITQHVVERRLDLHARLRLFLVVCRAVGAAHRQLIVHRDLKPSNILVSDDGAVKLLDFGIAKLLDEDESATRTGLAALTPDYAAPEQYRGGAISTATDVYALGVLLHELLLGVRPGASITRRPSLHLAEGRVDAGALPSAKPALQAALRGDLDNIVLMALASEPQRRYASGDAFAEDIERHLDGRPVLAHPPSRWYRTQKFVQRHRGGVMLTALFALGLIASLGITLWQASVARREALRANQQTQAARLEAERATAVRDLLVQLFENEAPGQPRSQLPDTAALLARGAELAQQRQASPEVQIDMLLVIGRVFDQVSRPDLARPLLERAVALAHAQPDPNRARLGEAISQLGQLELSQKHYAHALARFDQALPLQQAADPHSLATAMTLHRRALVYSETDRHDRAIADYRAALALRERALPAKSPLLINSYGALGTAFERARRSAQAEPLQRRALALARQVHGNVHEETARRASNLGNTLISLGRTAEAERLLSEAVAIDRRVFAAPNAAAAVRLHNLGSVQLLLGRIGAAQRNLLEGTAIEEKLGRTDTPGYGLLLIQQAQLHRILGDSGRAAALTRRGTDILRDLLGPAHFFALRAELHSAHLDLERGQSAVTARARIEAAQHALQNIPDRPLRAYARYLRGLTLIAESRRSIEGEREIERALAQIGAEKQLRFDPVAWYAPLAASQARRGDPALAMQTLRDGLAFSDWLALPSEHYLRARLLLDLAELESHTGQTVAAGQDAKTALAAMQAEFPPTHRWRRQADRLLARLRR